MRVAALLIAGVAVARASLTASEIEDVITEFQLADDNLVSAIGRLPDEFGRDNKAFQLVLQNFRTVTANLTEQAEKIKGTPPLPTNNPDDEDDDTDVAGDILEEYSTFTSYHAGAINDFAYQDDEIEDALGHDDVVEVLSAEQAAFKEWVEQSATAFSLVKKYFDKANKNVDDSLNKAIKRWKQGSSQPSEL